MYDVMPRVPDVQDGVKANVSPPRPHRPHRHFMYFAAERGLRDWLELTRTWRSVCVCASGAGAALAGVLRAGHDAAAVDQTPHPRLRGEEVPHQLRGDWGEWTEGFKSKNNSGDEAGETSLHPVSDLQVLWRQFLKFKETELPAKEADKNRSKHIFKSFEVSFSSAAPINLGSVMNSSRPQAPIKHTVLTLSLMSAVYRLISGAFLVAVCALRLKQLCFFSHYYRDKFQFYAWQLKSTDALGTLELCEAFTDS